MPENDLFESFTTMDQTHLHPLPASEVRRRGDRLRRRNTALAVAGGTVAAMTAIGVPVALSQDGTDARPDPGLYATDGPSTDAVAWRVDVPEDFPLTDGFPLEDPDRTQVLPEYQPQAVGPCATSPAWDVSGALESLQAVYTDPSQGGMDRVVSVYEDDTTAATALEELRTQAETCRPQGQPRVSAEVLSSDLGEQSVVFVNGYDDTGEGFLHQAVRVGNAVLYSTSYFQGAGDPSSPPTPAERLPPGITLRTHERPRPGGRGRSWRSGVRIRGCS